MAELESKKQNDEMVFCSCCGAFIPQGEDVAEPGSCDIGVGHCKNCFGDPKAEDFKKQIGWAMQVFCEARFPLIRKNLKPENKIKWDGLTYEKKCHVVQKLVEKGIII